MRYSKGFSLIELMVVIAIIAIIAAVAVPSYRQYLSRAKMAEIIQVANSYAMPVKNYYVQHGVWPWFTDLGYFDDGNGYIDGSASGSALRVWVGFNESAICNNTYGEVEVDFDPAAFGYDGTEAQLYFDFAEINGLIVTSCYLLGNSTNGYGDLAEMLANYCGSLYSTIGELDIAACAQ